MLKRLCRRRFLKQSIAVSVVPAVALSFEEKALIGKRKAGGFPASAEAGLQHGEIGFPSSAEAGLKDGEIGFPAKAESGLQHGKIGRIKISRLICGGNLISGFAHSRDLIYVSPLLKHYFKDEKVFETFNLCEENGINTAILRVDSHTIRLYTKYVNDSGGNIQWIAQAKPSEKNPQKDIDLAVDNGACMVYVHGGVCDSIAETGNVDFLAKALDAIRKKGVPAGLAAHKIATVKAFVKAGLEPDFYMKTLNSRNYWSAGPGEQHDNIWSETPGETIKFMNGIKKPWIAYKVLGAGAIHPKEGFKYVFENGADFACVGMFDFQVIEDVIIAKKTISKIKKRARQWC